MSAAISAPSGASLDAPSSLDIVSGGVGEDMTTRYTDEEWATFIADVEQEITVSSRNYAIPEPGSKEFAKTIDHTLLKLDAKPVQIDALCSEARVDEFATVCVRPNYVSRCATDLKGSDVKVASVIGFHEGTYDLYHKIKETKISLEAGADELDIVLNYPKLKVHANATIFHELATLRSQAPHPILLKLILETSQLTAPQIIAACALASAARFDFVKTSTGFNGHGAREEDVRLMAACCERFGGKMRVKASGGIRTVEDAVKMLEAGASRLGTSGGVWIVKEGKERSGKDAEARPGLATRLFTDY